MDFVKWTIMVDLTFSFKSVIVCNYLRKLFNRLKHYTNVQKQHKVDQQYKSNIDGNLILSFTNSRNMRKYSFVKRKLNETDKS